jgi:hypothetical protein
MDWFTLEFRVEKDEWEIKVGVAWILLFVVGVTVLIAA